MPYLDEIKNELSANWINNKATEVQIKQLKNNLENYFRNICKAKQKNILWTCYKDFIPKFKGRGYTKAWLDFKVS